MGALSGTPLSQEEGKEVDSRGDQQFALDMYFYELVVRIQVLTANSLKCWLCHSWGSFEGGYLQLQWQPVLFLLYWTFLKMQKNWPVEGRTCIISFNEISVRSILLYDTKHDVFIWFSDDRSERTTAVANAVFVSLVSWISRSWVMPVSWLLPKTALRVERSRDCYWPW